MYIKKSRQQVDEINTAFCLVLVDSVILGISTIHISIVLKQ